jgi:phosphatidylglycerophosphatase A
VNQANQPSSLPAAGPLTKWRSRTVGIFGTAFGLGYLPAAPGTWGTLPAVAIFLAVAALVKQPWQAAVLGGLLLAVSAAAVVLGNWAQGLFDGQDPRRAKDPRWFVLDEVAGFFLTVLLFPFGRLLERTVLAFLATRIMDIVKIPPARQLESLPGGWGILLDDLAASLYAAGLLHAAWLAYPPMFQWGWPGG